MHEISAAQNIVDILLRSVPAADLPTVRQVKIKVGSTSGVVPDSLAFAFEGLVRQTDLCNARLNIDLIACLVRCNTCGAVSLSDLGLALCPVCGSLKARIISGAELEVSEVELEDKDM